MAGVEVVRGLRLRIDEAERESSLGIDPLDQIVEITPPDREKPRSLFVGKRPFTKERRARATQACASVKFVAPAFPGREVNLGAQLAACALRIAAREQGDALERLAVDHRDGPAVGDAIDRVHQIPRWNPIDHQADVAKRVAANGKLTIEVVGCRRRRQRLYRTQRIIENRALQGFELAAVKRCASGNRVGLALQRTCDGHTLGIGTRTFRQPDRHVQGRSRDVDIGAQQRIPDHRRDDRLSPLRHHQAKAAGGVCLGHARLVFHVDRHAFDRLVRAIVDHEASYRTRLRNRSGGDAQREQG